MWIFQNFVKLYNNEQVHFKTLYQNYTKLKYNSRFYKLEFVSIETLVLLNLVKLKFREICIQTRLNQLLQITLNQIKLRHSQNIYVCYTLIFIYMNHNPNLSYTNQSPLLGVSIRWFQLGFANFDKTEPNNQECKLKTK